MAESADSASGALGTVLVAVTEIRPTGAYDGAGSPARNRRSFRCKGSADIVPHTELAGTTA